MTTVMGFVGDMAPGKSAWVALWLTTTSAFCSMVCTREFNPATVCRFGESVTGTTSGFEATPFVYWLFSPLGMPVALVGRTKSERAPAVYPTAATGVAVGLQLPTLPWSLPFTQKFGEVAAVNCGVAPSSVSAARKGRLRGGAATYCNIFLAPFGKTASAVTSRT